MLKRSSAHPRDLQARLLLHRISKSASDESRQQLTYMSVGTCEHLHARHRLPPCMHFGHRRVRAGGVAVRACPSPIHCLFTNRMHRVTVDTATTATTQNLQWYTSIRISAFSFSRESLIWCKKPSWSRSVSSCSAVVVCHSYLKECIPACSDSGHLQLLHSAQGPECQSPPRRPRLLIMNCIRSATRASR